MYQPIHLLFKFIFFFQQMTAQEERLCGLLLQEHFGEVVEKVGTHLLRSGNLNLRALVQETKLPLDLVSTYKSPLSR